MSQHASLWVSIGLLLPCVQLPRVLQLVRNLLVREELLPLLQATEASELDLRIRRQYSDTTENSDSDTQGHSDTNTKETSDKDTGSH